MRSLTKRAIGVAGLGSMTAVLTVAGIGTAQASDHQQKCGQVSIKHSEDGGQSWSTDGRINGDDAPTTITVKISGDVKKGCSYNVSLASYSAEGPSWKNSGAQAFLGWDTTTLDKKHTQATLDVSGSAPTCFGQVDLYGNGTKYDGTEGNALPHFPDSPTPTDLITAWNGGKECSTPTESPTPTPTETVPTPTATETTPTPTETVPTPTTTETTTATPTATPTTSAPAVDDTTSPSPTTTSTAPPVGSPVVPPASSSSGDLAETGGNGSQTALFGAGGAALLVIGGGAVYFTRRRNRSAHL